MSDQEPNLGGGGYTPLTPIGGPSLEEEERALKSGRGRMIAGMAFAVVVLLGGLIWFVMQGQPSEYGQLGRQINGMRADHFDAFWACALPRADLRDIDRADQLIGEISERSGTARPYAQHVRNECLVRLDEHNPQLDQLIIPADLTENVGQLRGAIDAQRTAWQAYLDHLNRLEGSFDSEDETTVRLITAIARGWYDYKVAHSAINATIRGHIDE